MNGHRCEPSCSVNRPQHCWTVNRLFIYFSFFTFYWSPFLLGECARCYIGMKRKFANLYSLFFPHYDYTYFQHNNFFAFSLPYLFRVTKMQIWEYSLQPIGLCSFANFDSFPRNEWHFLGGELMEDPPYFVRFILHQHHTFMPATIWESHSPSNDRFVGLMHAQKANKKKPSKKKKWQGNI